MQLATSRPTSSHITTDYLCAFFLLICTQAAHATNFTECFTRLQNEGTTTGGTFSDGSPAPIEEATGITYRLCLSKCGSEQEAFSWNTFSQQFNAWLLPWLALISQLPFGANLRVDNLVSVLLTVGSPTLAAYSIAITALNGQWVSRRFQVFTYPNAKKMSRILAGLQQAPLKVNQDKALLASLVILPENDEWFTELATFIEFEHTWSISAATNIGWVLVAYLFTVADSFDDVTRMVNSNGQAVGSLWLWLVPIVVGWLQIAPKIDSTRLTKAMSRANQLAHVATSHAGETRTFGVNISQDQRALSLANPTSHRIHPDEQATAPIFNYARCLHWASGVEEVASAYQHASEKISRNVPVDATQSWIEAPVASKRNYVLDENRRGTLEQVEAYCSPETSTMQQDPDATANDDLYPPTVTSAPSPLSTWSPGVFRRSVVASLVALVLQWATTGSAIIMVWFTPTTGLACRSGAYLGYGVLSTLVWLMMVSSSFLFHAANLRRSKLGHTDHSLRDPRFSSPWFLVVISGILRRLGKTIAAVNTVGILVACIAQFSHLFDTCYCNSSVIYWGAEKAFAVIQLSEKDVSSMRSAWVGALAMALTCAFGFVGFVNLYAETPAPTDS